MQSNECEAERVAALLVTVREATPEEVARARRRFMNDQTPTWWVRQIAGRERFEHYDQVALEKDASELREAIVRALVEG